MWKWYNQKYKSNKNIFNWYWESFVFYWKQVFIRAIEYLRATKCLRFIRTIRQKIFCFRGVGLAIFDRKLVKCISDFEHTILFTLHVLDLRVRSILRAIVSRWISHTYSRTLLNEQCRTALAVLFENNFGARSPPCFSKFIFDRNKKLFPFRILSNSLENRKSL